MFLCRATPPAWEPRSVALSTSDVGGIDFALSADTPAAALSALGDFITNPAVGVDPVMARASPPT